MRALREHGVLDAAPEEGFDEIVALASALCGTPIALVSLVDESRQWFLARVGLDARETPRDQAFCAHAISSDALFEIPDATADRRFADNPLVVGAPQIRFYAGMPLATASGHRLGTLCVIDRVPRELSAFQRGALATLARQVEARLALRLQLRQHEEFVAFVAHDLKNPLAAVAANLAFAVGVEGMPVAAREALDDAIESGQRVERLVLDLLDLGRAERAGLAPMLAATDVTALAAAVVEATNARTARDGLVAVVADEPAIAWADPALLRRVIENLVDNARKYGRPGGRVRVLVTSAASGVELRVVDEGPGIPHAERIRAFDKYVRLAPEGTPYGRSSHGLGLAFCRAAVEAMGGQIWIDDAVPRGAAFCVRVPNAPIARPG